ncbi:MAG: pentapeptide repeat-containing protein [Candidatus Tumulicola sp.]
MSASMVQALATAASGVTAVAINSLWEDALLVVCVWLLLRAWPGLNAATRYIVWSATLVATVVVPIATTLPFLTPSSSSPAMTATAVRVPIPMVTQALTAVPSGRTHAVHPRSPVPAAHSAASSVEPAAAPPRFPERFRMTLPLPVALAILGIWLVLAGLALTRLAIGLFRLEQLKRDALPLPVEYRDAMARWTRANKGSREVRLCVSDDIDVPVAVGLFDSMILIPRALLERLSENEVDQISLHELAHLRRADDWTNGLQRIAIALFAWNPGVQFVGQQLDLEREVACDDWVLASTGMVRPYAVCLAKMAETASWPHRPMPAPGVFATRKHISLRIERLLGAGRNAATSLSLGPAAATIAIVGALAFAMQLVAPSVAASIQSAAPETKAVATTPSQPAKTKEVIKYERLVATNETTATQQSAATPLPSPSVHVAPVQVHVAPMHVQVPATHVEMPATHVHVPPTHVHVPAVDVEIPGTDVLVPATSVHVPATSVHVSSTSVQVAGRSISIPQIDIGIPAIAQAAALKAAEARSVADASSIRTCNGCDLQGVNWSGRDMRGANLTGSDLSRANLQGTNFGGGTFNGVDFTNANLHGASFRNAHLTGCDFTRANLTGADFTGATMSGCQFTRAELGSSELRSILNTCTGCDFSHANLSGLDLTHVHVNGVDFSGANLSGANLSDSVFTGVDFGDAHMNGTVLVNTLFNGCDLGDVDLSHVDLSRAKFVGTDLSSRASPHP